MPDKSWSEAVERAVWRHVQRTGSTIFTRQGLIDDEMDFIVASTGTTGATPWQTLSRELQELRDRGLLEFVGAGVYRYAGLPVADAPVGATKGVFVTGSHSIYGDQPKESWEPSASITATILRIRKPNDCHFGTATFQPNDIAN